MVPILLLSVLAGLTGALWLAFAHHGAPYAITGSAQGIFWILIGLHLRSKQRASH